MFRWVRSHTPHRLSTSASRSSHCERARRLKPAGEFTIDNEQFTKGALCKFSIVNCKLDRAVMADPLPREFAESLENSRNRLGRLGSPVVFFSTIESTNDVASAIAASGDCESAVVIADEQTAGRVRRGHTWFSPAGSGLYVSIVLTPGRARVDRDRATTLLPLAAGVGLAEAVDLMTAPRIDIKWPNDLLVARRKLGGILAEAVTARALNTVDAVVLGYGINVGPMAYPPELTDRATSLESELDRPVERAQLWVETLAAISRRYEDLL